MDKEKLKRDNHKLHKFDKFPFGKYKDSTLNITNLVFVDLEYVLWFQKLEGIEYSKCIIDRIEKQQEVLYNHKIDKINYKPNKRRLLTDEFLEYSGLEEAFRNSYFR